MDRELAPLAKNGSIHSSEKQQQGDGGLDKTENSYGEISFIGFVIVQPSKSFWTTKDQFPLSNDGHKSS